MAQSETRKVTWSSIVGHRCFERGIRDYLQGLPFPCDYDAMRGDFAKAGHLWHYERGRLFAASLQGRRLPVPVQRTGRKVNRARIALASRLFKERDFT